MACVLFVIDLALPAGAPASELPIELPAADDRAGLPQYAATIVGGIDRCPGLRFGLSRLGETRGFLKMLVDAQSDRILGFGAGRRRERDRAEVDHGKYSLR